MYFLNFGLDITFYYHFYFNPVSVCIMVSFLSLFCYLMYLCIWVVNLLLLAPDDEFLRVETCAFFYICILMFIFKCLCLRRGYCLLQFDNGLVKLLRIQSVNILWAWSYVCSLLIHVSDVLTASIIRTSWDETTRRSISESSLIAVVMEAVSTYETSVNFYQTTWHSHLWTFEAEARLSNI
jgi:hypothetical protein